MNKKYVLTLSEPVRLQLRTLISKGHASARVLARALLSDIILIYSDIFQCNYVAGEEHLYAGKE